MHMIGYLKYFTNNLRERYHKFRNLGLVRTAKIPCDVTVMCADDSLHGVCFPTVIILSSIFSLLLSKDNTML